MTTDISIPGRMMDLPRDHRGYVVPWFVARIDGKADFRVIAPNRITEAVQQRRCWLCGRKLGSYLTFVIGPMCAINRISSEPPSHHECALYAVRVCPFLTRPKMHRRETGMPDEAEPPAGIGLTRNPGVALVWTTRQYGLVNPGDGGVLFRVGDPTETLWFCEGRTATRTEILDSIDSGLPALRTVAEEDGPRSMAALDAAHRKALTLLPPPAREAVTA